MVSVVRIEPAAASIHTCVEPKAQPSNPGGSTRDNFLAGVSAMFPGNVWAVGSYQSATTNRTLIEHWNGRKWIVQKSPSPAGGSFLQDVTAISASNVWAVGTFIDGKHNQTLIEHWNGAVWERVASPNPAGLSNNHQLLGVAATTASDVWAVGFIGTDFDYRTLIEHWDGTTWKRVPSPNPSSISLLFGVAAISATNAWAVGYFNIDATSRPLIEHWDGRAWTLVPSPVHATSQTLADVATVSASNVWAAGDSSDNAGRVDRTLIEHWNGKVWKVVPSPHEDADTSPTLFGVVAGASNVWAVGRTGISGNTLVDRWNGSTWTRVASPDPGSSRNLLLDVSAPSASNVWAVGASDDGPAAQTLVIRCR